MRGAVLYGPRDVRFEERDTSTCGIVEEVGSAVKSIKPGQFVIGSFLASDNTCPNCNALISEDNCMHSGVNQEGVDVREERV